MAGFDNDIMYANNADFSTAGAGGGSESNGLISNGQLWIGRTAVNAGGTHIDVNTLTAGTGITITNGPGTISIASTASLTDLHVARFIVASSTLGTGANYTSIAAAIAAAQATGINSTVFIQPGTYTENLTLVAGVNLTAFNCDPYTPNVTIIGNATATFAGTVSISGICLQTTSAPFLTVSGNSATLVYLNNCYLNCTNNTGISMTTSNASAQIRILECLGDLGTTGIAFHTSSSAGSIVYEYCHFSNSGNSVTANSNSAGVVNTFWSIFGNQFSTSSTGGYTGVYSEIAASGNTTALTANGTGSSGIYNCILFSGTASAVSVGTGATLVITESEISSSNTNAVTGAGTVDISSISFISTSNTINTTTFTRKVLLGAEYRGRDVSTAPSAGMIGERISSAVAQASALTNNNGAATTITSITLTPGIWDISAIGAQTGTITGTQLLFCISTATNALTGLALGDNSVDTPYCSQAGSDQMLSIPAWRVSISVSTTYYLVISSAYTVGTSKGYGRISGVRVA